MVTTAKLAEISRLEVRQYSSDDGFSSDDATTVTQR